MELTYVMGDDWEGLYVDGEIFDQGHNLDWRYIIESLFNVGIETRYADLGWLDQEGYLPESLEDVELETD